MPEWLASLAEGVTIAFTLVIMLVGLFGLVIPVFPGGIVIWLAALLYGIASNGFQTWGIVLFVIISLLAIAGALVDNILMGAQARKHGAAWWSLFWAMIGGLTGTILFPPFGGLVGAPLMLFVSEYWRRREWRAALKVTSGLLIGWGWSFLARFGIGVVMILLWIAWVWTNSHA